MAAPTSARTTARITLRAPTPDDAAPFLALVQASAALHHPWVVPPNTPANFRGYVARAEREHDVFPGHVCRLICRAADGAIVGAANLNNIVWGGLRGASLGYYAFTPYAGQGYMRAGVRQLLTDAFRRLGLHRIEAAIQPGNDRSRAVVASLGFRHEGDSPRFLKLAGRWRDHERWAITAEEWRPGRARGPRRREPPTPAGAPSSDPRDAERILGP